MSAYAKGLWKEIDVTDASLGSILYQLAAPQDASRATVPTGEQPLLLATLPQGSASAETGIPEVPAVFSSDSTLHP